MNPQLLNVPGFKTQMDGGECRQRQLLKRLGLKRYSTSSLAWVVELPAVNLAALPLVREMEALMRAVKP